MKAFLKKYWHWIALTLAFVALVFLHPDRNLVGVIRTRASVRRLKAEIHRYEEQVREDSLFLREIRDVRMLEKYAREKHLMHADDEQLFIIE